MSADDIEAINRYIQSTTATTTAAREDQAAWIKWYNNLNFFDKMLDSTTADASAKRDRFNIDNKTPPIPSVPLTAEESKYWQNAGVDVTGLTPEEAQKKAWQANPSNPMPVSMTVKRSQLKEGSTGDNVKEWQRIVGVAKIDGIFGPSTTKATKAWQKSHGLKDDGIVGPNTWNIAYGDLPKLNPEVPSPSTPASAQAATGPATPFAAPVTPTTAFAPTPSTPKPATQTVQPAITPTTPVKPIQAGMFGIFENLPNWAKWGLAIVGLGGFAYGLKYHSERK